MEFAKVKLALKFRLHTFPGCAAYAEGCAAYADGCAAYADGCAAYAEGCAAYAVGCAAYALQDSLVARTTYTLLFHNLGKYLSFCT